jgi:hypothetical protein
MSSTPSPNLPFHYFVSYAHSRGFGNVEMFLAEPIESYGDVTRIEQLLNRKGPVQSVVVLNYKQLPDVT